MRHRGESAGHRVWSQARRARREVGRDEELNGEVGRRNMELFSVFKPTRAKPAKLPAGFWLLTAGYLLKHVLEG